MQQNLGTAVAGRHPKAVLDKLQKTAESRRLSMSASTSVGGRIPAAPRRRPHGSGGRAGRTRRARRARRRARPAAASPLVALLWLGPALVLIAGVVLYPAIELVQASLARYSITGLRKGDAGWATTARCSATATSARS